MLKDLIIFPTDTVYGIGVKYDDLENVNKLYEIKGRDNEKPIAILVGHFEDVKLFAKPNEVFYTLAEAFWPGPLTIILEANDEFQKLTNRKTVGIRMPNHPLALKLLKKYGPLKTTSVNKSNEEPLNDYKEIKKIYKNKVKKIYKNKLTISLKSSTVISLVDDIKILREGEISLEDINIILKKESLK